MVAESSNHSKEYNANKEWEVYNYIPEAVHIKDKSRKIIYANKKFLSLFPDAVGKRCYEVINEDGSECSDCPLDEVLKSMNGVVIEKQHVSGRYFKVHYNPFRVRSSGKELSTELYVLGIATDITYIKSIEEKLRKSNIELNEFTSKIAHDIKTVITVVGGFSSILINRYRANIDEQGVELLTRIKDCAQGLEELINDTLEYARVGRINKAETDLDKLITHMIKELDPIVQEKNAEIIKDELPIVNADGVKIRRVFYNLITNAIKYNKNVPVIQIRYKSDNNNHIISVEDNGIGINKNDLERIFMPYERATNIDKGTGLGLSICKKIIELHKGKIWAESCPGKGSVFYLQIPK